MSLLDGVLERDLLPDPLLRIGIRRLLAQRLRSEQRGGPEAVAQRQDALLASLKESPLALATDEANEQHYEVPTGFYQHVLGHRLKYSGSWWGNDITTLDAAEDAMLDLYFERAKLADGQDILELGCGWGSLTLRMAERLPNARIVAVSNSATQRAYIEGEAQRLGFDNLEVRTRDMNVFGLDDELDGRFDRVVSIEMFEHMRNYQMLLERIARWLRPGGALFVHIFCHRDLSYPFEARGAGDWMARYFFTGGLMPAADLLPQFQDHLTLESRWLVNGTHYAKTSEAWLVNMDNHRAEIEPLFAATYGADSTRRWWVYWRLFFLSCAELFGYRGGEEWLVAHYRFVNG